MTPLNRGLGRIGASALIQGGRIDPVPQEQERYLWLRSWAQGLAWATLNSTPVKEKRFWHVQRSLDEQMGEVSVVGQSLEMSDTENPRHTKPFARSF